MFDSTLIGESGPLVAVLVQDSMGYIQMAPLDRVEFPNPQRQREDANEKPPVQRCAVRFRYDGGDRKYLYIALRHGGLPPPLDRIFIIERRRPYSALRVSITARPVRLASI